MRLEEGFAERDLVVRYRGAVFIMLNMISKPFVFFAESIDTGRAIKIHHASGGAFQTHFLFDRAAAHRIGCAKSAVYVH